MFVEKKFCSARHVQAGTGELAATTGSILNKLKDSIKDKNYLYRYGNAPLSHERGVH